MQEDLRSVHDHMIRLGRAALSHANYHSCFYSFEGEMWDEMSVLQAAHAAEIFIKARIAQEHPLLIFDKMPRSTQAGNDLLSFKDLVKNAKTISYLDLPERLWAATGIKVPNLDLYKSFGQLRNTIQHFTVPDEWPCDTKTFIYEVIDPFINECWGLYAIDHHEDNDSYNNIVDVLISSEVPFLLSPTCESELGGHESLLDDCSDRYRKIMLEKLSKRK
ncbi:hypothetical protein ACWXWU_13495 [Shewanella sp. A14]